MPLVKLIELRACLNIFDCLKVLWECQEVASLWSSQKQILL